MMPREIPLLEYADNIIVWAILALALSCYVLLLNFLLAPRDQAWRQQVGNWLKVLAVLLGALPLLGLLGTINGLLATFRAMGISGGLDQQAMLSSGIADALITTQLGLVTLVPGLLLHAWLRSRYRQRIRQ
jgi:biopolymer transport protein ExbB